MEIQLTASNALDGRKRERLLRALAVATFIIFFQAYMVAPTMPALSKIFGTSIETVGLIVPGYLIPMASRPWLTGCSRIGSAFIA